MTTIILAHKKIAASILPVFNFEEVSERFAHLNRRGIASGLILAVLAVGISGYLMALFFSFSLGFYIQDSAIVQDALYEALLKEELLAQEKINLLANRDNSILESMERVSAIKYLTEKSVALHQ